MIATSSTKPNYTKAVINPRGSEFAALIRSADAFICAAGFEARARLAPMAAKAARNPIVVEFVNGPVENDKTRDIFKSLFRKNPGFERCELNWARVEEFAANFENSLRKLQNLRSGEIVMDITGLPNFAICVAIAKIRQIMPISRLTLLHTEAEEYFPQKKDFDRIEHSSGRANQTATSEYLTGPAVNLFMPAMFSGVALGHNDTCLIVFAGYEPHRTTCVIEATNPSKLVMVYGEPDRTDLKWRLELSRIMHRRTDDQLMKTEEVSSTSEVSDNLRLLLEYYEYLYDDHILCVSPINSKMQAVAAVLAWEIYPDIQLAFPIPAEYLAKKFSIESRDTFKINLGLPRAAQKFLQ